MDKLLYVAMSGAQQTMLAQTANTHNLANVTTTGFQADLSAFRSMPVFGDGAPTRVYSMAERPGVDFTSGSLQSTGRDLDVAVQGEGWIAVQAPDGTEAYTRAGELRMDETGLLTNGAGHPVLGNGGPVVIPPASKIAIGGDGTISIQPMGEAVTTLAVIDRIKLVNPPHDQLYKADDGLLRTMDGAPAAADGAVKVVGGALETSNVNAVEAMVNMINLTRQYEMQVKMMSTAEENDNATNQLLRMS
jgi:flagellar basal-body rod protein FlgF